MISTRTVTKNNKELTLHVFAFRIMNWEAVDGKWRSYVQPFNIYTYGDTPQEALQKAIDEFQDLKIAGNNEIIVLEDGNRLEYFEYMGTWRAIKENKDGQELLYCAYTKEEILDFFT